jgi:methionyl-tRNA synthetase
VKRKEDIDECGTILNVSLNTIKTLGVVVEPFLPFAGEKIRKMLVEDEDNMKWHRAAEPLPEGRELGEPEILFEKLQ